MKAGMSTVNGPVGRMLPILQMVCRECSPAISGVIASGSWLFEQEPEWAAAARENSERSKNQPEDFEQPSESESFTHPSWLSASSTEQREHDSEEIMAAETSGQQVQLAKDQVAEDKAEEQQTTRWIFRLSRRK